jgi:hypothetical protein
VGFWDSTPLENETLTSHFLLFLFAKMASENIPSIYRIDNSFQLLDICSPMVIT